MMRALTLFGLLLVSALSLAACASAQRTLSYPATMPDADVRVGGYRYQVWFHPTDRTILLQRGEPRPLGQVLAQNLTVYSADQTEPTPIWAAAANAVLQQIACQATDITGADQQREVSFSCVEGVNVQAEVAQRRETWRRGVSVPDPTVTPPRTDTW